jgi:hypothetical protein
LIDGVIVNLLHRLEDNGNATLKIEAKQWLIAGYKRVEQRSCCNENNDDERAIPS